MAMSGSIYTSYYGSKCVRADWHASRSGRSASISFACYVAGSDPNSYYMVGPVALWANGTQWINWQGRVQGWLGTQVGTGGNLGVGYDSAGNASFVMTCSAAIYSSSLNCHSGNIAQSLDNIGPAAPSYNSTNASKITTNSAYLSASINTQGQSITGGGWDVGTSTSSYKYYSGGPTGATISGLKPNTTYYYRGYVTTAGGGANSSWKTFKTLAPTPPVINQVTVTPVVKITPRDESYITIDIDTTIASGYTVSKVEYSLDNGASYVKKGTSLSFDVDVDPNTQHQVKVRITDSYGSVTESSAFDVSVPLPPKPYVSSITLISSDKHSISVRAEGVGWFKDNSTTVNTTMNGKWYLNGESKGSFSSSSTIVTNTFNNLLDDTDYSITLTIEDKYGQVSDKYSPPLVVHTLSGDFISVIKDEASTICKSYVINGDNPFNRLKKNGLSTPKTGSGSFWLDPVPDEITPDKDGYCLINYDNSASTDDYEIDLFTTYLNTVNGNEDNKDSIDLSNMTNYTAITVAQCTEGSFKYRFALSNEESVLRYPSGVSTEYDVGIDNITNITELEKHNSTRFTIKIIVPAGVKVSGKLMLMITDRTFTDLQKYLYYPKYVTYKPPGTTKFIDDMVSIIKSPNLFNKDDPTMVSNLLINDDSLSLVSDSSSVTVIVPVQPNKHYRVTRTINTDRFQMFATKELPTAGLTATWKYKQSSVNSTDYELTHITAPSDAYLCILVLNTTARPDLSTTDILNDIRVEEI